MLTGENHNRNPVPTEFSADAECVPLCVLFMRARECVLGDIFDT